MTDHSRGSTISRLRVETGADIQVGKDDDLITIIGGKSYRLIVNGGVVANKE